MEARSRAARATGCSDAVSQLKRQFEQWRGGRKAGEQIPQELWAGAVDLVRQHGACRVAAELHLDYAVLKRRAGLSGGKVGASVAPQFVELFAPKTPLATLHPECVVELDNARGAKMRVELSGKGLSGLSSLCSAFWAA